MTSVVAKVVFKFWPQWAEDVQAQFAKYDPNGTGRIPRHMFFSCMSACGLDLTTLVCDKLLKEYGVGVQLNYFTFMKNLEKEVKEITATYENGEMTSKKNDSVIAGIIDGSIDPKTARSEGSNGKNMYDYLEKEEPIDDNEAKADFRQRFFKWVDKVIETYETDQSKKAKQAEDMSADELDRYASLFFLLISEENRKKGVDEASTRGLPELMLCIPEWPQITINFNNFHKVCKRELAGCHHLQQVFSAIALPAQSIHTTMTFQQFSVLVCGVSNASISRMIKALKMAPNSSAVSSVNSNSGNGLYSRFNTWKDFPMGYVSGKSFFKGIRDSIPTEPDATIEKFVSDCIRKGARRADWADEPVLFSEFGKLMREDDKCSNEVMFENYNEKQNNTDEDDHHCDCDRPDASQHMDKHDQNNMNCHGTEGTEGAEMKQAEAEANEEKDEQKLSNSVKAAVLEATMNNPDKIYDMLAYAAINNPPYKSDFVTIEAIIRTITAGLGVRLTPQQQAVVTRRLRDASQSRSDLVPVRLFMEVFNIMPRGPLSVIPPIITSPERHGRRTANAQEESATSTPVIPSQASVENAIRRNSSQNVLDVFKHQNDLPPQKGTPRRIEMTGVQESFLLGPEKPRVSTPRHEVDLVSKEIVEDPALYAKKRQESLDHATISEAKLRRLGYSNDLYRGENVTPQRPNTRMGSSSGLMDALSWE